MTVDQIKSHATLRCMDSNRIDIGVSTARGREADASSIDHGKASSPWAEQPAKDQGEVVSTRHSPTRGSQYLTISDVAEIFRCGQDKVLGWINRRELEAINIANAESKRPQWRIRPADLTRFENRRSSVAIGTTTSHTESGRKAKKASVRNWFPNLQ